MERPSKCCYPDCFHCPYDDCMTDIYTEEECISDKQLGVSYYSRNRERILAKNKQDRLENGEEIRRKDRERYASLTPEEKVLRNEKNKKYYYKNREKILANKAKYRDKHREEINRKQREKNRLKKAL